MVETTNTTQGTAGEPTCRVVEMVDEIYHNLNCISRAEGTVSIFLTQCKHLHIPYGRCSDINDIKTRNFSANHIHDDQTTSPVNVYHN